MLLNQSYNTGLHTASTVDTGWKSEDAGKRRHFPVMRKGALGRESRCCVIDISEFSGRAPPSAPPSSRNMENQVEGWRYMSHSRVTQSSVLIFRCPQIPFSASLNTDQTWPRLAQHPVYPEVLSFCTWLTAVISEHWIFPSWRGCMMFRHLVPSTSQTKTLLEY